MNLIRWEPLREVDEFFRQYSPLFSRERQRENGGWTPTANVIESEKEFLIKAELPEVKKEDVKVTLDNGVITISGERRREKEDKTANEIRVESFYGMFSRSFQLPDNIDVNAIRAESKDGVLRLHIPKTEAVKPKAIAVEIK